MHRAKTNVVFPGRGDDVFGESPGCLKVYNAGPGALLTPKPPSWSFEEAPEGESSVRRFSAGALVPRIGFWGPLYYTSYKEPPR